jgi:hypothetical protein
MRAVARHVIFEPDPRSLPDDPARFVLQARLLVGTSDGPGEEAFDLTVCTPEWLAGRVRNEGIVSGLHLLIIDADTFDERAVRSWLERRVSAIEGTSWGELAARLSRIGWWEFEDYIESPG